jgi:hypothetical protein
LQEILDAYFRAAGIDGKGERPVFRCAIISPGQLCGGPVLRRDVWRAVRRRARDAGTPH